MRHKVLTLVVLVLAATLLSGCYINERVQANQMGVRLKDGRIKEVVGPGRYSGGWFSELVRVDVSAKTLEWEDPDLWTSDKQPLKFKVGITYARTRDPEELAEMWTSYNAEMRDDSVLARQVINRIPRVAKQVTTQFTLDEMLGIAGETSGREIIQDRMAELLEEELAEFGVVLLDIGANDIGADDAYVEKLKEKAAAKIAVEVAQQRTEQLREQVEQEKAQTEVELEIARRERAVAEEGAAVYEMSREAYELKRLELLANVMGDNDKVIFLPEGTDLSLLFSGQGQVLPISE